MLPGKHFGPGECIRPRPSFTEVFISYLQMHYFTLHTEQRGALVIILMEKPCVGLHVGQILVAKKYAVQRLHLKKVYKFNVFIFGVKE